MPLKGHATGICAATGAALSAVVMLTLALLPSRAGAQTDSEITRPCEAKPTPPPAPETVQTFFLTGASEVNDLNEIQTDLRNVLPKAKIFGVQSQNAITMRATAEDLETAQKMIADLDRPRKLYRLTFTITDMDGGKRTGEQHFVLLAISGERTSFKQGSRVPIVTGGSDSQTQSSQVQYQDIGLDIEATVTGSPDALLLRSRVVQSSIADERTSAAAQDPVVRQTVLDESSQLPQGKPLILGSLDLPGTTRRQEIAVVAELVR